MSKSLEQKSSIEEIKRRFDNDVAQFSNLETGQSATIDAPLAMELIAQAAVKSTGNIRRVLDIGCGAGNNTIKLLLRKVGFKHTDILHKNSCFAAFGAIKRC
jgi:tRNA (cmo5U34)-methyltransferase